MGVSRWGEVSGGVPSYNGFPGPEATYNPLDVLGGGASLGRDAISYVESVVSGNGGSGKTFVAERGGEGGVGGPAYIATDRLRAMLDECLRHLPPGDGYEASFGEPSYADMAAILRELLAHRER